MYDVAIFDLDGTITESEPGIVNSVQYTLDVMGYRDHAGYELKRFIGPPLYEAMRETMGMDDATALEAVRIYRERFGSVGWMENSVYRGLPLLLKSLKQHGVYVAMATSKPEVYAKKIAEHFGFGQYVDRIEATSLTDMHSNKAELVRRALPKGYSRACMVGDRWLDIEGGKANGIETVGVAYGYGTREELERAGADYVVDDVEGLTNHLLCGRPQAMGKFITFEGIDGCGKTTQWKRLAAWLEICGYDVIRTREPGGSPMAEKIRSLVLDPLSVGMTDLCEAYLFAASRAQHVRDVVKPGVERGAAVICDRFVDSSVAYQGAGRGLGNALVQAINAEATRGCMPDLTMLFDLDEQTAAQRRAQNGEPDRIEREPLEFVARVREGFLTIARQQPERVRVIDASGAPDDVFERVRALAMAALA